MKLVDLGRFLYEAMKIAYYWKSDESIYERECGNMPGFAVYYRYPNSRRVTYGQFIKVHWKWSQRITRLLIQCLESTEYMEIRNALIMLTKISSVFPVTRKSGINLEKRVKVVSEMVSFKLKYYIVVPSNHLLISYFFFPCHLGS